MTENEEKALDENNCPCCNKKWDSNNIIKLKETGNYTKHKLLIFPTNWEEAYYVTYRLLCKDCKISTSFTKYILKKDFKPKCENKVKETQKS